MVQSSEGLLPIVKNLSLNHILKTRQDGESCYIYFSPVVKVVKEKDFGSSSSSFFSAMETTEVASRSPPHVGSEASGQG